jgi:hypothetical protein
MKKKKNAINANGVELLPFPTYSQLPKIGSWGVWDANAGSKAPVTCTIISSEELVRSSQTVYQVKFSFFFFPTTESRPIKPNLT